GAKEGIGEGQGAVVATDNNQAIALLHVRQGQSQVVTHVESGGIAILIHQLPVALFSEGNIFSQGDSEQPFFTDSDVVEFKATVNVGLGQIGDINGNGIV